MNASDYFNRLQGTNQGNGTPEGGAQPNDVQFAQKPLGGTGPITMRGGLVAGNGIVPQRTKNIGQGAE